MDDTTGLGRALMALGKAQRRAIGAQLAVWRQRAGWTQARLAEVAGLRRDRVARLECGAALADAGTITLIADCIGDRHAPPSERCATLGLVGGAS